MMIYMLFYTIYWDALKRNISTDTLQLFRKANNTRGNSINFKAIVSSKDWIEAKHLYWNNLNFYLNKNFVLFKDWE
jgi:hypothetical protein